MPWSHEKDLFIPKQNAFILKLHYALNIASHIPTISLSTGFGPEYTCKISIISPSQVAHARVSSKPFHLARFQCCKTFFHRKAIRYVHKTKPVFFTLEIQLKKKDWKTEEVNYHSEFKQLWPHSLQCDKMYHTQWCGASGRGCDTNGLFCLHGIKHLGEELVPGADHVWLELFSLWE